MTTTRIDRHLLHRFLDSTLDRIDGTPMPAGVRALVGVDVPDPDDQEAVWVAAGIASQIGKVIVDAPWLFILDAPAEMAALWAS